MGIINNKKCKLYRIGGIPNHIHLLVDIHPTLAVSDFEGWAVSFAGFTYSLKEKQTIIDYIKNQKEHHKKVSFEVEYRQFLIENGIDIDERYFLKD
jgi:putative transposase